MKITSRENYRLYGNIQKLCLWMHIICVVCGVDRCLLYLLFSHTIHVIHLLLQALILRDTGILMVISVDFDDTYGCSKCLKRFSNSFGRTNYSGFDRESWIKCTNRHVQHRQDALALAQSTSKSALQRNESKSGCRYSVLLELLYLDAPHIYVCNGIAKHYTLHLVMQYNYSHLICISVYMHGRMLMHHNIACCVSVKDR